MTDEQRAPAARKPRRTSAKSAPPPEPATEATAQPAGERAEPVEAAGQSAVEPSAAGQSAVEPSAAGQSAVEPSAAEQSAPAPDPRVAELSYFFPAHNEEANLEALVDEALATLPGLARRFEIVAVNDGSRDRTGDIADVLAARNPDVVRVVHHPTNLGYGAALRSGFQASRFDLVAFTDGDRQFHVVDIGRLIDRLDQTDRPDVVVGYRLERADPFVRRLYARIYRFANRVWFGLPVRDIDCACKLFRRDALRGVCVESGGAFFTAEMLIKLREAGRSIAEVGVPHYPRTAGSATGAKPSVVFRAVRDFWLLRLRLWANKKRALRRGEPMVR